LLTAREAFGERQGMARWARVVVPGMPQHVTQRGKRRQPTFFGEEDDAADVELLAQWCQQRGVEGWAYCRMPNPGHGIAVPRAW
jgi:putative transposase